MRGFIWKGLKCNKARDESERKRFMRGCLRRRVAQWEAATWKSYPSFPYLFRPLSLFSFFLLHVLYMFSSPSSRESPARRNKEKKNSSNKSLLGHHHRSSSLAPDLNLFFLSPRRAPSSPAESPSPRAPPEKKNEAAVNQRDVGARGDHREEDEEAVGEWYFADSVRNFIPLV